MCGDAREAGNHARVVVPERLIIMFLRLQVIRTLCALGVPDTLSTGPQTAVQLSTATGEHCVSPSSRQQRN
jgi:hypothetical protein